MLRLPLSKLVLLCVLLWNVEGVKWCRNLKKDKLVPDYVARVTPQCGVEFSKGVSAECGNVLLPGVTSTEPTIAYKFFRNCRNATIIAMDPDAIGVVPPFLHMLSTNIPRSCIKNGYNSNTCKAGDLQASYVAPGGPGHRYLFCVFCQREYIEPHKYGLLEDGSRTKFDMKEYARSHSLSLKACNYFKLISDPVVNDTLKS